MVQLKIKGTWLGNKTPVVHTSHSLINLLSSSDVDYFKIGVELLCENNKSELLSALKYANTFFDKGKCKKHTGVIYNKADSLKIKMMDVLKFSEYNVIYDL